MIHHIEGKLTEKTPAYAVIDCGGVGYLLNISLHTYSKIGERENCRLYTHLVIREDAHVLYGFFDTEERAIFLQLISVSGVGAATARMILSSLSPADVKQAIASGNVGQLKNIKGIGEKTAQRIIVDLRGKISEAAEMPQNLLVSNNKTKEEALIALVNLGFAKQAAEKALLKSLQTGSPDKTVEQLIKEALKNL